MSSVVIYIPRSLFVLKMHNLGVFLFSVVSKISSEILPDQPNDARRNVRVDESLGDFIKNVTIPNCALPFYMCHQTKNVILTFKMYTNFIIFILNFIILWFTINL